MKYKRQPRAITWREVQDRNALIPSLDSTPPIVDTWMQEKEQRRVQRRWGRRLVQPARLERATFGFGGQ